MKTKQIIFILISILQYVTNFEFIYPFITLDTLIINTPATYTFSATRSYDTNLNLTPWDTQKVPAGSQIRIMFPKQYQTLSATTISCDLLIINDAPIFTPWSCTQEGTSGNLYISIVNAIDQDFAVNNFSIVVSAILNPKPALTTGSFVLHIGNDQSANITGTATVSLEGDTFTSCSITFDPSYVNTTGSMVFQIELQNQIQQNGFFTFQFPPSLQWQNDISTSHRIPIEGTLECSLQNIVSFPFIDSLSCQGSSSTQIVTVTPQYASVGTLTGTIIISISNIFSPPSTQPIDILELKSKSSEGYDIDMCQTRIQSLTPKVMQISLSATANPFYVNRAGGLRIDFTLVDTIQRTDYFRLYFPSGSKVSYLFKSTSLSLNSSTIYDSDGEYLTFTQSNSARNYFQSQSHYITFLSYTAPQSTRQTDDFRFVVMTDTGYQKMDGTDTLQAINKDYVLSISSSNTIVSKQAIYTLSFFMTDPLTSSGKLKISVPNILNFKDSPSCPTLTPSSTIKSNPPCTFTYNTNDVEIQMTQINATSSDIIAQAIQIQIYDILNYYSVVTVSGFTVNTYYSSENIDLVAIASGGIVELQPSNINIVSIAINQTLTGQPYIQWTFTINSENGFPQQNSQIWLVIPETLIPIETVSCTIITQTLDNPVNCQFINNTLIILLQSIVMDPVSEFKIVANTFKNPATTAPIVFFIQTFSSQSNLMEISNFGYYFNNFLTPRGFIQLSVQADNPQNFQITPYLFNFKLQLLQSQIQNNTLLILQFPLQAIYSLDSECIKNDFITSIPCTVSNSSISILIDDIIICTQQICQFSFYITDVTNPESYQPTSTFSVSLQTSNQFDYAFDNTALFITNSIPKQFPTIVYEFSNTTYGGHNTDMQINITSSTTDSKILKIDVSNYQYQDPINLDCSQSSFSVSYCNFYSNNDSVVIEAINSLPQISVISLKNLFITPMPPQNISQITKYIAVSSYNPNQFLIHQSQQEIYFQPFCTLPCATCSVNQSTYCLSCYQPDLIYQAQCISQCPIGSYESEPGLQCSDCNQQCKQCFVQSSFCTSCNFFEGYLLFKNQSVNTSTCLLECPSTTFESNDTCLDCQQPCFQCIDTAITCQVCLSTYFSFYNISQDTPSLQCLSLCPQDITIGNIDLMLCEYCEYPCSLCQDTLTNCTDCQPGFFFIDFNLLSNETENTCIQTCPQNMISVDNVTCEFCSEPCLNCRAQKTTCLTCIQGYYKSSLDEFDCVQTCQFLSFANEETSTCQLCSTIPDLNCFNCSSQTSCYQCDDPAKSQYVFFPLNQTCLETVPQGYVNISGIAVECTSNCSECSIVQDNCTICQGIFGLYIDSNNNTLTGQCLQQCPSGYTIVDNICQQCVDPCLECEGAVDSCTSCLPSKITHNGQCIDPNSCPIFTYPVLDTQSCQPCQSPCQACINATYCETCANGSLITGGACVAQCPETQIPILTQIQVDGEKIETYVCTLCLNPCLECSISDFNCTSCIQSFYYYPQIYRCFQTCPQNISISDDDSLTCKQCLSPCKNCSRTVNTCMSCVKDYYLAYNSTNCVNNCGAGFYPETGFCEKCTNNCSTCSSSNLCLTCSGQYYLYENQCITECPVTHAIYSDNRCESCQQWCLNCSKAFNSEQSICYQCQNPTILYNSTCLEKCPENLILYLNETNGKYHCLTQQQYSQIQLGISLTLDSLFPLPFTITGCIFMVATFMSRLQFQGTYIIGIGYCLFGILQTASFFYLILGVYGAPSSSNEVTQTVSDGNNSIQYDPNIFTLALIVIAIIYGLNILALITQTIFLFNDRQFKKWVTKSQAKDSDSGLQQTPRNDCCNNYHSFIAVSIISLLTSYKMKILLFTGLFKFDGLSAILDSVQKFRIFNVFSFFGFIHQALAMYLIFQIFQLGVQYEGNQLLFLALVDVIIITVICFIFAILSTKKDDNYFDVIRAASQDRAEQQSLIDSQGNVKKIQTSHQKIFVSKPGQGIRSDMKGIKAMDSQSRINAQQDSDQDDQILSLTISQEQRKQQIDQLQINHNIFNLARGNKVTNAFWVQSEGDKIEKKKRQDNKNIKQSKSGNPPMPIKKFKISQNDKQAQKQKIKKQEYKDTNKSKKNDDIASKVMSLLPSKPSILYQNMLYKKNQNTKQNQIKQKSKRKQSQQFIRQKSNSDQVQQVSKMAAKQGSISTPAIQKMQKLNKNIESSEINAIYSKDANNSHQQPSFEQLLPFVHNQQRGQFVYINKNTSQNKNIFDRPLQEVSDQQKYIEKSIAKTPSKNRQQDDEIEQIKLQKQKKINKQNLTAQKINKGRVPTQKVSIQISKLNNSIGEQKSNTNNLNKNSLNKKKVRQSQKRQQIQKNSEIANRSIDIDGSKQIKNRESKNVGFIRNKESKNSDDLLIITKGGQHNKSIDKSVYSKNEKTSQIKGEQDQIQTVKLEQKREKIVQNIQNIQKQKQFESNQKQANNQKQIHNKNQSHVNQQQQNKNQSPQNRSKQHIQQCKQQTKQQQQQIDKQIIKQKHKQQKIYRRKHQIEDSRDSLDGKLAEKQSKLQIIKSDLKKQINRKKSWEKLSKQKHRIDFSMVHQRQASIRKQKILNYSVSGDQYSRQQQDNNHTIKNKGSSVKQQTIKQLNIIENNIKNKIQPSLKSETISQRKSKQLKDKNIELQNGKQRNTQVYQIQQQNQKKQMQVNNHQLVSNIVQTNRVQHKQSYQPIINNQGSVCKQSSKKSLILSNKVQNEQIIHKQILQSNKQGSDKHDQHPQDNQQQATHRQQQVIHRQQQVTHRQQQVIHRQQQVTHQQQQVIHRQQIKKSGQFTKQKAPIFYLEQSSLAMRKSQYNQSQKLSNPFDYCNNPNISKEVEDRYHLNIEQSDQSEQMDENIETNNRKHIMRLQSHSQVPNFNNLNHVNQGNGFFINKITQENSQLQQQYDDSQLNQAPVNKNKVVSRNQDKQKLAKNLQIRPINRQRKRIPVDDRDQNLHVKDLQPKIYNQNFPQSQDMLQRKSPTKHPLQKVRSPSADKNRWPSSDDDEDIQIVRNRRKPSYQAKNREKQKKIDYSQFQKIPQKFEYQQQLDKKIAIQKTSFKDDQQLLSWKKKFSHKNEDDYQQSQNMTYGMQIPQKPQVQSSNRRNSDHRYQQFSYQETQDNLSRPKLYQFEQVERPMRGSTSKSGSKSKRRSQSRKGTKSSLQKIYTQKFAKR